jgi:membrane carboxypeptidase/penicillin-binding protein PbpC
MAKELTPQQRANKKWNEKNRAHRNYLTKRSAARGFIRNHATKEDLLELQELIQKNLKKF